MTFNVGDFSYHSPQLPRADPGFQVTGGGGRREHFWGISCEKTRFYAKKSYFFQFWGGGRVPDALPSGSAPGYILTLHNES
jgi:hypothetical protein